MKNEYEKLFDDFMNLTGLKLVQYKDGWGVVSRIGVRRKYFEYEKFEDAAQLLNHMVGYVDDYLVAPIKEKMNIDTHTLHVLGISWSELAKRLRSATGENEKEVSILDMICNHSHEVDLKNCIYGIAEREVII